MQRAFEELRKKFAHSTYLGQPDDSQDCIINTDASVKAKGAVLMQRDKDGRINIVSTALLILKPAERRYTTCKLELMAIVYALRKFRICIYVHKVTLNSDHKSLIVLKKCVVTSNRVACWMLESEQWELEIKYIKDIWQIF
jgi:ribonuclease HI